MSTVYLRHPYQKLDTVKAFYRITVVRIRGVYLLVENLGPGVVRFSGVIRRFYPDCQPDIRFASSGSARFDFGREPGSFRRVQILQDKTLLVTGFSTPANTTRGFVAKIYGKRKL